MKATINNKILKNILFLSAVCLSVFLLTGNAIGRGGPPVDDPATIGGILPDGQVGTPYSKTLNGGVCDDNYVWTLTGGSLPDGLSWPGYPADYSGQNITISGTPSSVVTNLDVTIQLDGNGCTATSKTFTITIIPGSDPIITTEEFLWGLEGVAYNDSVSGTQGNTPYAWSLSSGDFPPGLTLDPNTGAISGSPIDDPLGTLPAIYIFTVTLTDVNSKTYSKEFSIGIQSYLQIVTLESTLGQGTEGLSYSFTFTGAGGDGSPYVWTLPGEGNDPGLIPNLIMNPSTGELSGIPVQEGYYTFTVRLADGSGNFVDRDYRLKVNAGSLAFDTTVLPATGTACATYSALVTGTGGTPPYSWNITGGSMPSGLTIASNGTPSTTISGTPVENGTFIFTVSLTDAIGTSRQQTYNIEITGNPSGCSVDMDYNTAYPPFVATSVTPNVLLILDNSGSMYEFAYKDDGDGNSSSDKDTQFKPAMDYYGYFDCSQGTWAADGAYTYSSATSYTYVAAGDYFKRQGATLALEPVIFTGNADGNGDIFDGCFLNWLTMRRVDVARKVLTGGKYDSVNNYMVLAERTNRNFWKEYNAQTYYAGSGSPYAQLTACTSISRWGCSGISYDLKIKVASEPTGVIHETYDSVRWGLMFFNTYNGGYVSIELDGGPEPEPPLPPIDPAHFDNLILAIRTVNPTTWTPLAETMYEAIRYYQHTNSAYNSGVDYSTWDDPIQFECQKNFVIVLTDGESSKDENLPSSCFGSSISDLNFNIQTYMTRIANNEGFSSDNGMDIGVTWGEQDCKNANTIDGTFYLEGVTYYANTNDIRTDMIDEQNITTYTIFAFDESPIGEGILQTAAKYGAFKDSNANTPYLKPDLQAEWDKDKNGIPDRYFKAAEGSSLAIKLKRALFDILQKKASGTSTAVLATTSKGEGAAYQAYFLPSKVTVAGSADWLGGVYGLFLDRYGNIREDTTGGDRRLCYGDAKDPAGCTSANRIVRMYYDVTAEKILARLYPGAPSDLNDDGKPISAPVEEGVEFDDINVLWNAGDVLWSTNAGDRKILTTLSGYDFSTGLPSVDSATGSNFYDGHDDELQAELGAGDAAKSADIINYIRGMDISGYRPRTIGPGDLNSDNDAVDPGESGVWKLGDIVYSTPLVVAKPKENYDFLYNDISYFYFVNQYFNRRHVVYTGANDGMLHAFNAGFYDARNLRYCKGDDADADGIISGSECADVGATHPDFGDELWGFIPRGLLPNLKLLTSIDYTHVYYVDLKPKITDVKIFDCNSPPGVHVGYGNDPVCWGTILIGGLRYGAKAAPEYFALDITDPLNPRMLWTFSDPDLGATVSRPAIARTCNSTGGDCKWFAVFGSGAIDYNTDSDLTAFQAGNIYVLDISSGANGVITSWNDTNFWKMSTTKSESFMFDPVSVDVDLDYDVDVFYIAENYRDSGTWNSRILRITTNKGTQNNPADWTLSTLADISMIDPDGNDKARRITSAPSISMDDAANLWAFFGTGQFLGLNDKNRTETGGFYGVKDGCWDGVSPCPKEYNNLYDVSGVAICQGGDGTSCGTGAELFTDVQVDVDAVDGWVIYFEDLIETTDFEGQTLFHTGERALTKPLVIGGLVTWTTYIPGDEECSPEGTSNVYSVYYTTGTSWMNYAFESQRQSASAGEVVARTKSLGIGMASAPSVQVTQGGVVKIFVSDSLGNLVEIRTLPAISVIPEDTIWTSDGVPDSDCGL